MTWHDTTQNKRSGPRFTIHIKTYWRGSDMVDALVSRLIEIQKMFPYYVLGYLHSA